MNAAHSSTGTDLRPNARLHSGAWSQTAAYRTCGAASAASVTASEGLPRESLPAARDHIFFFFVLFYPVFVGINERIRENRRDKETVCVLLCFF